MPDCCSKLLTTKTSTLLDALTPRKFIILEGRQRIRHHDPQYHEKPRELPINGRLVAIRKATIATLRSVSKPRHGRTGYNRCSGGAYETQIPTKVMQHAGRHTRHLPVSTRCYAAVPAHDHSTAAIKGITPSLWRTHSPMDTNPAP